MKIISISFNAYRVIYTYHCKLVTISQALLLLTFFFCPVYKHFPNVATLVKYKLCKLFVH